MGIERMSEQSRRILERTKSVIDGARDRGIVLRVLGGTDVLLHSHSEVHRSLVREVRDTDLVVENGKAGALARMLRELGFEENRRFNLLNGRERLIFYDPRLRTQLDIFFKNLNIKRLSWLISPIR